MRTREDNGRKEKVKATVCDRKKGKERKERKKERREVNAREGEQKRENSWVRLK